MPSLNDPAMLLFYGLDESQPNATRLNVGYLGSAQNLSVVQSSGTDGIPAVSDGNGGRALDVFQARTGFTTASRCLRGAQATGSAHTARPTMPLTSANDDFAFGVRCMFKGANTGGGAIETEYVFGLSSVAAPTTAAWGMGWEPDDASAPTAARIRLFRMATGETISSSGYTTTGSPPSYYLLKNEWYRIIVRYFYNGSTGYLVKAYVLRESTGEVFTFTKNSAVTVDANAASFNSATDTAVHVSVQSVSSTFAIFGGYVDEAWLFDAPVSDDDATTTVTGGFVVAWDPPSYRMADHVVHVATTRQGRDFPVTRPLATGCLSADVPPDVLAQRPRVRIEGWRPGRPWLLRSAEMMFDTAGPFSGKAGNRFRYDDPNAALYRAGGVLPPGTWEDVRNVESTVLGPRRRRGFRIRRSVATDMGTNSANAFFFFRSNSDTLYGVYKVGSKLFEETGSGVASLDSGWNSSQLPVFMFLDNRAIVLSGARRKTWRGQSGTIESFGIDAGSTGTVLAGSGGTLNATYYYAWTEYDPNTGDESAPKVTASVSPSTQKVTLTMSAVNSDTRFSQRRIYRTTANGSPPNLFLIATITSATTYDDTGVADGTVLVGQVTDSSGVLLAYLTGSLPDSFSIGCVHSERCFYSNGATAPERIYVSEANEPQRFYSSYYLVCEGPVKALVSWGHRLVAFTDSTTEIFESDWIRDADGNVNVQRFVVSRTVGCDGPHAARVIEGALFWKDRRAIWTMKGTDPVPLSGPIRDLFPYMNHAVSYRTTCSFNHIRRQVWFALPHATLQVDSDRFQTILVLDLDALNEGKVKWSIYEQEATFHRSFDDDLNGLQFGLIDGQGVFKQVETYEGDGAQGNESYTTEDEGGSSGSVGISSISGQVVTVFGSPGWTTNALRGMSVVLRDRSTGLLYWHLITTNTSNTLTLLGTINAALAARDGYYIGGIRSYLQFAEQDAGTPNVKVARRLHLEFAALTRTDLYL